MKITRLINSFKHSLVGSISDLNYYLDVLNTPFRFSLKVFIGFYLLLGLFLTGVFSARDLPRLNQQMNDARDQLVREYPTNLNFSWQNQTLSSNSTEVIEVPYPHSVKPNADAPKHLLVIDTNTDQPPSVSALLFINQKKMYVNTPQGGWNETELVGFLGEGPQFLDKKRVLELADSSKMTQSQVSKTVPLLAVLVFTVGLVLVRVVTITIDSVIVQFFFQIMNKPVYYKKVFQLSMHVLIPAELINQFKAFFFPDLQLPMFGLSYWLIMTLIIWHFRHLQILQFEEKKEEAVQVKKKG